MKKINIALDGHAGGGKSTTAKILAKKLAYIYVDSGAMYRAITLFVIENDVDLNNTEAVENALRSIEIDFKLNEQNQHNDVFLNGKNVEDKIRKMEVTARVSEVSAIKEVREFLVKKQQEIGLKKGVVMDGRDIGTVVFPEAELKVFMTASIEARAQRRLMEMKAKGQEVNLEEIKQNLESRDHQDSTRKESPLRKAEDAIDIDTSDLTIEEQVEKILNLALQIIN
ncbi:(d)CMP kinase [Flexithrix dorotheae]|uniref:(d)CMP kinase n=1 Tax=Flexithrix dorotheae TaxID=70993 RepID=UPI000381438D|nr:(d)CMP kinase [Flexithrix dorotheae]